MTNRKPLHVPHGSRHVSDDAWADEPRMIPAAWHAIAEEKGYRIDRRVRDRFHVVLECLDCGAHTVQWVNTLRSAQPACGGCQEARMRENAIRAGVVLGARDERHRHYASYTLPCGHVARLQRGRIAKLAEEGPAPGRRGYHCDICYDNKLQVQAAKLGWSVIGVDPDGDANYRLLEHDTCGSRQRVATGNLATGRFDCGGCGESWVSAPSLIYMMRFRVPGHGVYVKLGYSCRPYRRMRFELGLRHDVEAELVDEVPMPSGQVAKRVEFNLHHQLETDHPDKVIPRAMLADWINVTSEVYAAEMEPAIQRMLDEVASPEWPRASARDDRPAH